jgi:probable phosphoglycerate mutase
LRVSESSSSGMVSSWVFTIAAASSMRVCIPGGESPDQVILRQRESLEYIMSKKQESSVLICMHGRALRIFMCLLLNYPLKHMNLFPHNNTGLYKITHTGRHYRLDKANCLYHLSSNGTMNGS